MGACEACEGGGVGRAIGGMRGALGEAVALLPFEVDELGVEV